MFKHPFSFEGRIRRKEYALSYLITFTSSFLLGFVLEYDKIDIAVQCIIMVPFYWFMFAQGAKRCHDMGETGWYQLIPFYAIWMLFEDSEKGESEYGPNPKGIDDGLETVETP